MASLLEELFHDVKRRAEEIATELKTCSGSLPAEVEAYRAKMEQRAARAASLSEAILRDPDLKQGLFAQNYYRDFRDIARLVQALEHLPLLVLRRFNDRDLAMTRMMTRLCREANYPYPAPICSSLSSQYYWTMPDMDLIFIPSLEPDRLLGLPDIYHEVGHIVLFREEARFKAPALGEVERHFDRILKDAQRANWPPDSLAEVEIYRHFWRSSWWLEFGADLIATYLVGPSFGWCNIRTSTTLGGELYRGSESHPADDARAAAVGFMLQLMSAKTDADEIQRRWTELVALASESRPQRYDCFYPTGLLESLCKLTLQTCKDIGLTAWNSTQQDENGVVMRLQRAWKEFRLRPESFAGYELQVLQAMSAG